MTGDVTCPNPVMHADAAALVRLLALLEAAIWATNLINICGTSCASFSPGAGRLPDAARDDELRQAVNDMNHRLRHALGEYDEPPTATPVPR
jgi:hypothetical protein